MEDAGSKNGASEGIRTLDIHVGNVTLYQTELRSLPKRAEASYENPAGMQALFWPRQMPGVIRPG
jgi:hypothetical protein